MGMIILIYGVVVYAAFFVSFLYLLAFVGGDMLAFVGVPKTLDWGQPAQSIGPSALMNIFLLALFGVQHTAMARQGFKKALLRVIPESAERSTYVLATTIILVFIYMYWQPMPQEVWSVQLPFWSSLLTVLFLLGFGLVLLSTFLINHFELFGLMQVWYRFKGRDMPQPTFRSPMLYKWMRHPLYLGWITFFWATPTMTVGHLLFAAIWTIYIFIALGYEERDLLNVFGDKYRDYMSRVPMILPIGRRKD